MGSQKNNSRKGFTLVELVIVMAVIAVILSVVIPNLRGMQCAVSIPKADTLGWAWDNVNQRATWTGHGRLISNAPTLHQ